MKIILILSLFLMGCAAGQMPEFPKTIKNHWLTEVRDPSLSPEESTYMALEPVREAIVNYDSITVMAEGQVVRCLKFEIVSSIPYKIKFLEFVAVKECNGVGGYKPDDSKSLYNWMSDVKGWADDLGSCIKR